MALYDQMPPMNGMPQPMAGQPPGMGPAGMDGGRLRFNPDGMPPPEMDPMMAPTGGPPSPETMGMANQLYQTQQMVMQLQREVADLRSKRVALSFTFRRDPDGRLVGIDAQEGV